MADDIVPRQMVLLAHVLNDQFPSPEAVQIPMASTSSQSSANPLPPIPSFNGRAQRNALALYSQTVPQHSNQPSNIDFDIDVDRDTPPQDDLSTGTEPDHDHDSASSSSLKRMASPEFESTSTAKRIREDDEDDANSDDDMDVSGTDSHPNTDSRLKAKQKDKDSVARIDGEALAEHLAQELQCGCCAGLVYKPVIVTPCQHFFCGSCCTLWIKNGGTSCPACRGASTVVTPSRALQAMVDVLLRAAPHRARSEREKQQADEVYPNSRALRFPEPREPSPEPNIPTSTDFIRPCPHCNPGNPYGWHCPTPIVDPNADAENAWHAEDGTPPGHGFCGNCEVVLALRAPTTTKCDLCQVSFCGINVQSRCSALPLMQQHPHDLSDVGDLIQSSEIYDCFDGNTIEVDYMLDHLTAQRLTPRHVYREIVTHILSQPAGFRPLIEDDLFIDVHPVTGGIDPDPDAPRQRICRRCAAEVVLYGVRDWWVRERRKGFLDPDSEMEKRKDCPEGRECRMQSDLAHAREFNHIIIPPLPESEANNTHDGAVAGGSQSQAAPSATSTHLPPSEQPQTQAQPPRIHPQDIPLPLSPDRILPALPPQIPAGSSASAGTSSDGTNTNSTSSNPLPSDFVRSGADIDFASVMEPAQVPIAFPLSWTIGDAASAGRMGSTLVQQFSLYDNLHSQPQQSQQQDQQHSSSPSLPNPLVLRHHREPGGNIVLPSFGSLFARFNGGGDVGGLGESASTSGADGNMSLSEDEESLSRDTVEGIIGKGKNAVVDRHRGAAGNINAPSTSTSTTSESLGDRDREQDRDSEPEVPGPADTPLDRSLEYENEQGKKDMILSSNTEDNLPSSELSVLEVEQVLAEASSQGSESGPILRSRSSSGAGVRMVPPNQYVDVVASSSAGSSSSSSGSSASISNRFALSHEELGVMFSGGAGLFETNGHSHSHVHGPHRVRGFSKEFDPSVSNLDLPLGVDIVVQQLEQNLHGSHFMDGTSIPITRGD